MRQDGFWEMNLTPPLIHAGLLVGLATVSLGQNPTESENLLQFFDPESQIIAGEWALEETSLQVLPSRLARCVVKEDVPANYDLQVDFTRREGDDSVVVILPVGEVSPALELSAWQGEAHGLSRLNQTSARDEENPTSTRPGTLVNGERYRLEVRVRSEEGNAEISAMLNGERLLDWSGAISQLEPNVVMNLPQTGAVGLAAQEGDVVFHEVSLLAVPDAVMVKPEPSGAEGLLSGLGASGSPGWERLNEAQFQVATEETGTVVSSIAEVGTGDRLAFLEDMTFSEGEIELDLRGSGTPGGSFLGVAFHGEDGDTYDAIYFRPFNFNHSDPVRRSHAVQYMSHPDWGWAKLREERPDEFESMATPEPSSDSWFHALIQIKGTRVQVFVDGATTPTLDVEKMSTITTGKVGVWFNGVASFANLEIRPD